MNPNEDPVAIALVGVDFGGASEREAEFESWYADVHTPFVRLQGPSSATRYHLIRTMHAEMPDTPADAPKYLAIYHFSNIEDLKNFASQGAHLGRQQRDDKWTPEDFQVRWAGLFEVVKEY